MLVSVERSPVPPSELYDNFPHGLGENPGSDVPGEIVVYVAGLGVKRNPNITDRGSAVELSKVLPDKVTVADALQEGVVGEIIEKAHKRGDHVGFRWRVNEVQLFVAKHATAITAGAAITVAGAVAIGVIHKLASHKKEQ